MKKIIIIAAACLLTLAAYYLFTTASRFVSKFQKMSEVEISDSVYVLKNNFFTAYNVNSGRIDTIHFKGKTIFSFWATWCTPCLKELPSLHELTKNLENTSIILLTFDSLAQNHNFLAKHQINLPVYYLTDTTIFKFPQILPKTIITRGNTVLKEIYGETNWTDTSIIRDIKNMYK